jgi:carbamate kinase
MSSTPVVVALGGNALLRRGEPTDAATQRRNVAHAMTSLVALAERGPLVVTHGNGPQVGLLALQAAAYDGAEPYPLDVLGAETEGMIGYLVAQELRNVLPGREIATLLTQVVVDPDDQAFTRPTKPIGPSYSERAAGELRQARGWTIDRDGTSWRRVVASPEPWSTAMYSAESRPCRTGRPVGPTRRCDRVPAAIGSRPGHGQRSRTCVGTGRPSQRVREAGPADNERAGRR